MNITNNQINNFWIKVDKNKSKTYWNGTLCWEWIASKRDDYGCFGIEGKIEGSHRISWFLENGVIPTGMFVLHHCDNRSCVNPEHLFLGTNQDNMTDMKLKGRAGRAMGLSNGSYTHPEKRPDNHGERGGGAKLTNQDVLEIRKLYGEKIMTAKKLSEKYGVTDFHIYRLIRRERWNHI